MAVLKPRAIVALDVPDAARARALTARLGVGCDFVKVGLELFTAEGPAIVRAMRGEGRDVFLDLKLHDIPNTVRAAARSAAHTGAALVTVHASGGSAMLEAAVEGAGTHCGVLAVTVLTSLDAGSLGAAWGRSGLEIGEEVLRLAGLTRAAGAHGVVCSGLEATAVTEEFGEGLAVLVPGIRRSGAATHDQARTVTPGAAVVAGARYLVLGRAVTGATDPGAELRSIREEMADAVG